MAFQSWLVTLVVLILTILMVRKWGWRPIIARIKERQKFISDQQRSAEQARADAERLKVQLEAEYSNARQEVFKIIAQGEDRGRREYEKLVNAGELEKQRIIAEGQNRNQANHQTMVNEFEVQKRSYLAEGILALLNTLPGDQLKQQTEASIAKLETEGFFGKESKRHGG